MPVIGARCPPESPTAGETHSFDHCIYSCPHQCMPTGVIACIAKDVRDNEHKGDMISATSIKKGCDRQFKLERTVDHYAELNKLYYATRGGIYHAFLEVDGYEGFVTEKRVFKVIDTPHGKVVVSGKMDHYDKARRRLEDYKTMADKGIFFIIKEGPKDDHVLQQNIYRFLCWGGYLGSPTTVEEAERLIAEGAEQVFLDIDEMLLHYTLMNRVVTTGRRFVERYVQNSPPNTTKTEVDRKIFRDKRGRQIYDITYEIPAVDVWPFEKTERIITERAPELARLFKDADYMPPGIMDEKSEMWRCDFCSVRRECEAIEKTAGRSFPLLAKTAKDTNEQVRQIQEQRRDGIAGSGGQSDPTPRPGTGANRDRGDGKPARRGFRRPDQPSSDRAGNARRRSARGTDAGLLPEGQHGTDASVLVDRHGDAARGREASEPTSGTLF